MSLTQKPEARGNEVLPPDTLGPGRFVQVDESSALAALLQSPFVADTLSQLFGGDLRVQESPEYSPSLAGYVERDIPDLINIEFGNAPFRRHWHRTHGEPEEVPFWEPESVLAHEMTHSLDLLDKMPLPIQAQIFRQIYEGRTELSPTSVSLLADRPDEIQTEIAQEGLAESVQEAFAFIRNQGPYEDPSNRNLIFLKERNPGAITALSWIANNVKDTSKKDE